jgi:predicted nucleic acid-binding protein
VTRQPRAVADVNVLVSAARTPNGLCGRLLEAAIAGRWQLVMSMMLFEELEDVIAAFTALLTNAIGSIRERMDRLEDVDTVTADLLHGVVARLEENL